jgi:ABC-type transport system involved in multi-copper enzyme maturation permease subunit
MNPVAGRELQERFRSMRSPVLLSVWVMAAGALTFLAYLFVRSAAESRLVGVGFGGLGSVFAANSMGAFILHALLLGLLTAVVFVVPGQAAVTIVGERDRQTLQLLQVSQLGAPRIVIGKLASALAFILLLLVVVTPLLVIPVLLGGVDVADLLRGVLMVAATAVTIGAISMWISARSKSMQGAVLGSYVMAAVLVFGTLALSGAEILLARPADSGPTRYERGIPRDEGRELYSTWLSPYLGLVDASSNVLQFGGEVVPSPYQPFRQVLVKRQGYAGSSAWSLYDAFYGGFATSEGGFRTVAVGDGHMEMQMQQQLPTEIRSVDPIRGSVWWRTLVFQALVTLLALWAAARLIRVPRRRLLRRRPAEVRDAA